VSAREISNNSFQRDRRNVKNLSLFTSTLSLLLSLKGFMKKRSVLYAAQEMALKGLGGQISEFYVGGAGVAASRDLWRQKA
jgi:hypothetical protein